MARLSIIEGDPPWVSRRSFLTGTAFCQIPPSHSPVHSAPSSRTSTSPSSSKKQAAPSSASFADVARAAGIDFHLTCGGAEKRYIMESMCGGIAVLDYDNDGWMDIFLVNGSTLEDLQTKKCHPSRLYHNNHDGTFTDVTVKSGLTHCGWGFGVAVGDYDNDGWEDLMSTISMAACFITTITTVPSPM